MYLFLCFGVNQVDLCLPPLRSCCGAGDGFEQNLTLATRMGDEGAASITLLGPGIKNSRLRNGLEFDQAIGLLQLVAYEVIPANQEHFESLA